MIFAHQRFTDRTGDREADLIILWPGHGIAVIEVKGGLIHLIDGQWRKPWSSDPRGWRPIDPIEQALKSKYALRDYLFQHPGWSRRNPRLIHLLALPATQLDVDFQTPDCPRWLVMDRTDIPHAAERIVEALRQLGPQPAPPTHDDILAFVQAVEQVPLGHRGTGDALAGGGRRAQEMLYVGLSRARDLLVVCGDIDVITRVDGDGVVQRLTKPTKPTKSGADPSRA